MDKFDLKIKSAKTNLYAKDNTADIVMKSIAKSKLSAFIGWTMVGLLFVSLAFLLMNIFGNYETVSFFSMLVNDFDIVVGYPTEYLVSFSQSLPWLNLVSTFGIALIAVWYFKKLKYYVG